MRHHHSTRSGVHAHRATASLTECHHAISRGALGAVERFVRGLEYFFGGALLLSFGHADADSDRHTGSARTCTFLATLLVVLRTAVLIAQLNVVGGDGFADDFQVRHALFEGLAREHQGKFLTAVAICPTA